MPVDQANASSTPSSGTGTGGLRGAANAIAGMLSDDFTITSEDGNSDAERRETPRNARQQSREDDRREPSRRDDDEPVHREEAEEIDEDGNVRFREADHDADELDEDGHDADRDDDQDRSNSKELKDDSKIAVPTGDGKTEEVTLGELKKGYLRESDYTKKTQALSLERTDLQKIRTDVDSERTSLKASIEAVGAFVKELIPQEPTAAQWEELRIADPARYAASREEWRSFKERLAGIGNALKTVQDGQKAEMERTMSETLKSERVKLAEAMPEWKDERVKKRDVADMVETAKAIGFTAEDVNNTVDHRLLVLLKKAAKYDRLMSAKSKLSEQRGRSEPTKVMAPGAKSQTPTRARATDDARKAHQKSQSIRSGAALLEKLL
jgi:hypothetical protein